MGANLYLPGFSDFILGDRQRSFGINHALNISLLAKVDPNFWKGCSSAIFTGL